MCVTFCAVETMPLKTCSIVVPRMSTLSEQWMAVSVNDGLSLGPALELEVRLASLQAPSGDANQFQLTYLQ